MDHDPHRIAEQRSIAIHGLVAERLRERPELLQAARRRVAGWLQGDSVSKHYAESWKEVLSQDIDRIAEILVHPSERARALRQVSPFAGAIEATARWRVWREVHDFRASATERRQGEPMTREQLEHIIRASASIANDPEIVVIGSQSILGRYPDAPADLLVSAEADVFPRNHPERAELIDGAIGELSSFHSTFGYYAHGVGPETARLPAGWEERLVPVAGPETQGATGLCLEPHDLVCAKYVAGREQDRAFARTAARHGLVQEATLIERLSETDIDPKQREAIEARIREDFGS